MSLSKSLILKSVFLTAFISSFSQAATTTSTETVSAPNESTVTIEAPKPMFNTSNIILGAKSSNDSGRAGVLETDNERVYKSKNEAYVGYRFNSGWGGFFQGVQYYNAYRNNSTKSVWSVGDSSLTLVHPDFYKDDNLSLGGQLRYYIPTTDRSVDKKIEQYAYYLKLGYKFSGNQDIYNELTPRYFNSKKYSSTDTTYYIEDTTIYGYKLNSSWKVGAKSWAQYEVHSATPAGFSWEAGPMAVYNVNSNISLSPSISLPISVSNKVYDGPKAVSMDQAYMSLFIQAKL